MDVTALKLEFTNAESHHFSCALPNNYSTITKTKQKYFQYIVFFYLHDASTFALNAKVAKKCYLDIQL